MKIGKKNGLLIFLYSLIQSRTKTLHGQARRLRIVVYMIISTFLHTSPFSTTSARSRPPKPIKWRRNSTEQCAIQEGCVHSTVDSNDIICLLPPIFCFVLFFFCRCWFSLSVHGTRRSSQLCDATLFNSRQKNAFPFLLLDML